MLNRLFNVKTILLCIFAAITSAGYFLLNGSQSTGYELTTFIDKTIPFCSYFVIPYIFWYLYMFIIIGYFVFAKQKNPESILLCLSSQAIILSIIFWAFPTMMHRPNIQIHNILDNIVSLIYKLDAPYNCFPSMHVTGCMIATLFFVRHCKRPILQYSSIITCTLILLSTLFIKQHYFYDVIGGIALAIPLFIFWEYYSANVWIAVKHYLCFRRNLPSKFGTKNAAA